MYCTISILSKAALFSALLFLFQSCAESGVKNTTPWIPLFDGKSLNGWTQKGGDATFRVQNSTIIG